ncbi:MAG: trypsin-like serine protease [Mesorhizobium sp.]|uniref:trypsin-like serine protease n=1 Tax=Mesorhizobium sp. TaxID=1871066 RepID=UPI000FE8C35E|nr:trypsin-like serine protease [Mesorhizobium sp.]RWP10022.1 MAG: trypsin-like serine protease [Mesorhizobium sp.]
MAFAEAKLVTFDDIKRISPIAKDEFVRAIVDAEDDFKAAGITTRLRIAHFLAQVMTETGGLKRLDENMKYNFPTLMRVFSRKTVSEAKAREIAGKERDVANWVYGARLGNKGRHTSDGWDYRGSGFMQLTGRTNFRLRGKAINLPLEQSPEMARQAREGLLAALAYWEAQKVNTAADDHDILRVRILVNGPRAEGLPASKEFFDRAWKRVFRDKRGAGFEGSDIAEAMASNEVLDESALFDGIMEESGLLDSSATESAGDLARARADGLKRFQRELGLTETGELDEATKEELLDPREWRYRVDPDLAPARPETDLEQTVTFQLNATPEGGTEGATVPAEIEPKVGSGTTVENANITQEDLQSLNEAKGVYAQYEIGDASITPETFVPFSVIMPDTRAPVTDTTGFPARAIVQILFETRSGSQHLCTGTMVSKDTVLTAGHCIHSGTSVGEPYQNFRVMPGRNVGAAPFGRCSGRAAFVLAGWTASITADESRSYDLGAIKLDCDVGNRTGWVGVRTLGDEEVGLGTRVEGYAADRAPTGRQWISEDKIGLLWEFKGFYQNDTFGGTSGAGVFATGANDVLIGVHTNGLHGDLEPWKSYNAFTRITPDRLALINQWIGQ